MRFEGFGVETVGGRRLVDGLSGEFCDPVRLLVVGVSGSGKSSLLGAIAGCSVHKVRGSVSINGVSGAGVVGGGARRVLMAVQEASEAFTAYRRILPQLEESGGGEGLGAWRGRFSVACDLLGLDEGSAARYPSEVSGGMLKRLLLAGLSAWGPELLLLDEPTSGVDPVWRRAVWGLVSSYGGGIVVATHDLDAVRAIRGSRVLRLHGEGKWSIEPGGEG